MESIPEQYSVNLQCDKGRDILNNKFINDFPIVYIFSNSHSLEHLVYINIEVIL